MLGAVPLPGQVIAEHRTFLSTRTFVAMPKAEAKNAVKFTRMCKFWKTNECKMGADCTFAHSSTELRPSPKPCFDFVKNGCCARGQSCRFVHEVVEMKTTDKFVEVQHSTVRSQRTTEAGPFLANYAMSNFNSLRIPSAQQALQFTVQPRAGQLPLTSMEPMWGLMESQYPLNPCIRPPPGLEHLRSGPAPPVSERPCRDGDSRRSSLSDVSLGLEFVKLPISKAADLDHGDDATVATQSLTSTMCLSATPSSFSEAESPSKVTSFWL